MYAMSDIHARQFCKSQSMFKLNVWAWLTLVLYNVIAAVMRETNDTAPDTVPNSVV